MSGKPHGQPGPLRELGNVVSHGDLQTHVLEQGGMQLVRKIVQVVGELHDLVPNHRELSGDRLRWGDRGSFHALQVDGQSCESLMEVVMQFARDPPALLFLGLDQLHRQRFQFLPLFAKQEKLF